MLFCYIRSVGLSCTLANKYDDDDDVNNRQTHEYDTNEAKNAYS